MTQSAAYLSIAVLFLAGCAGTKPPPTPEEIMAMPDARMRSIILTDVELQGVRIEDAVRYLSQRALEADPEKIGVQIHYRSFDVHDSSWRITLRFQQATVAQVLNEACRQARCNYLVGKDAVTVMPEDFLKRANTSLRQWP